MGRRVSACLLDTNAFAMTLTDDPRLPAVAREEVLGATSVFVSVISFYEIGQKVRLGKWPDMATHVAGLEATARTAGYDLLSLNAQAAMQAALLEWAHRDPFDRIIASVAMAEGLPLVSSDTAFDDLGLARIWTKKL